MGKRGPIRSLFCSQGRICTFDWWEIDPQVGTRSSKFGHDWLCHWSYCENLHDWHLDWHVGLWLVCSPNSSEKGPPGSHQCELRRRSFELILAAFERRQFFLCAVSRIVEIAQFLTDFKKCRRVKVGQKPSFGDPQDCNIYKGCSPRSNNFSCK